METLTMPGHPSAAVRREAPLWSLGFRPFFLLASLFAVLAILLWAGIYLGWLRPVGFLNPILWHAHEMIYGYATAVIAGFVLTASQNWTGRRGVHGRQLQFLVAIWLAGRVLMSAGEHASLLVTVVDLAFYPCLAYAMVPYLRPSAMKVERVFFLYFVLYFAGNLLIHLDGLGVLPGRGMRGALLGVDTTILMIIFMGGRVIPFFTESERSRNQPRSRAWVEILSHASAWAFLVSQLFLPLSGIAAAIAFAAALIHLIRLAGWQVPRVRKAPLLWVLHLAYLWIALGFALFGLVSLGLLSLGPAVHAFTIGALGAMTYGMMSRVALGHTGRKLVPAPAVVAGYLLLNFACLVRVLGPIFFIARPAEWVAAAGALWVAAFGAFIFVYAPMLLAPRADH